MIVFQEFENIGFLFHQKRSLSNVQSLANRRSNNHLYLREISVCCVLVHLKKYHFLDQERVGMESQKS